MEKNILHSVFFDEYNHWDKLVDKYDERIREVVQSEVNKFRHCGEIVRGFRLFVCEGCNGEMIPEYFVSHTGIVYDNRTHN